MATEFRLPELGENIETGNVTKILVAPGDDVRVDQPVLEIETDKAVLEVPSNISGKVTEIRAKEGQRISVGQVVLVLSGEGTPVVPSPEAPKAVTPPTQRRAPQASAQPAAAKVQERPATPAAREQVVEPRQEARETSEELKAHPQAPEESISAETAPNAEASEGAIERDRALSRPGGEPAPASPSVRRLAREIGVDVNQVRGSGPGGRISAEDVKLHARQMNVDLGGVVHRAHGGVHTAVEPLPDFARWGEIDRQDMTSIRRRTADHMAHAWATIPHVTQFDKADITELERMRKAFGKRVEAGGGKLTVTAILIKLVAHALQKFPQFNTSIDVANGQIIYKQYYNIGIAVDTDRGLLVPVIRDADKKNITEIAVELNALADRARNRKATLDDMQGGTFTITNLGGIGGTAFTPIVNSPEVAILGVARTQVEPVYVDGHFQPRSMLPLALSYDHRVIDGADGARFLTWLVNIIEQPMLLFMEG